MSRSGDVSLTRPVRFASQRAGQCAKVEYGLGFPRISAPIRRACSRPSQAPSLPLLNTAASFLSPHQPPTAFRRSASLACSDLCAISCRSRHFPSAGMQRVGAYSDWQAAAS